MKDTQLNTEILVYTRIPKNDYTESLCNSIHFAIKEGNGDFQPLNQNYGILFALAAVDSNNVIHEKGLRSPYIFRTKDDSYGILAIRVDNQGKDDIEGKGHILLWTSKDLTSFHYCGLVRLHEERFVKEAVCQYNKDGAVYEILWQDTEGNTYSNTMQDITQVNGISLPTAAAAYRKDCAEAILPDILPGNQIEIDKETAAAVRKQWIPIYNTEIRVSESVRISSAAQLQEIKATAVYSDGSTADKKVQWDAAGINFSIPGSYTVKGKVMGKDYPFPLATGYADPVILLWENKYYYIATNDNVDDIGIYVREGNSISDLFSPGYQESIILNVDEERDFIQTFWAPEFHMIGDDLYILFAVSGKKWGPQCHMMKLKRGGNILKAEDWETPVRVKRADGTFLTQDGITLDMTYFKANGTSCVLWSYRKDIGTPLDTGSMIYIATIDESNPTVLTSEPVLLTRPLYGWENIQGTINNEGPYPLVTEDTVYITYSAGAANGYTYALGLLSIPVDGDFLDAKAWRKAAAPVLSYYSIDGVYGPGHNSFFRDKDGEVMIMYHGEVKLAAQDIRCTGMHRVHFNADGVPVFNMSKERDLDPSLTEVSLKVIV
jgi:GH43 family beta-xylosidase